MSKGRLEAFSDAVYVAAIPLAFVNPWIATGIWWFSAHSHR